MRRLIIASGPWVVSPGPFPVSAEAQGEALGLALRLGALLDDVAVRGLRACGAEELARLRSQRDGLAGMGATYLAEVLDVLLADLDSGRREGARSLLRARTSLRVFERLLSLRMVGGALAEALAGADADDDEPTDG